MCYYYRTRYACSHTCFTNCARICCVQKEHLANPEACPPCNDKAPHPLCTICVNSKCNQCRQLDEKMRNLKSELGSLRKRVEKLEDARDSTKRLAERAHMTLEENPQLRVEKAKGLGKEANETKKRLGKYVEEVRETVLGGHEGWDSDESDAGGVPLNLLSEAGEVFGEVLSS